MLPFRKQLLRRRIRRGDASRDARDWQAAALAYRGALALRPALPHIWVQYGHALKEAGQLLDAEHAYRRALSLDRQVGDTYLQLGHVVKMQGRLDEAAQSYRHAYIADPDLPEIRAELAALGIDPASLIPLPKTFR